MAFPKHGVFGYAFDNLCNIMAEHLEKSQLPALSGKPADSLGFLTVKAGISFRMQKTVWARYGIESWRLHFHGASLPAFPKYKYDLFLCLKAPGTRIIPLVIEKDKMERAKAVGGNAPIFQLKPFQKKKAGIVATGNEVYYGRIQDTFTPVVEEKLAEYSADIIGREVSGDNPEQIEEKIRLLLKKGAELIICTGGMSVDPDDKTPAAIRRAAAEVVTYGAPVLPGAMFLLAYTRQDVPILGLPGCVMYAKRTIFDLVLPRIMAGEKLEKEDFDILGEGGLCLSPGSLNGTDTGVLNL